MNQTQIGIHPLEPYIFPFQFLNSGQFANAQSPVLGPPVIKSGITDAVLATDVSNLHPLFVLVEDGNDLRFAET